MSRFPLYHHQRFGGGKKNKDDGTANQDAHGCKRQYLENMNSQFDESDSKRKYATPLQFVLSV